MHAPLGTEDFGNEMYAMHWPNGCNMQCNVQLQLFAWLLIHEFRNIPLVL